VPYRYLVERAIEPDVTVGLGGPRVVAPGAVGTYGLTVHSVTNIDTPRVFLQFRVPELGKNSEINFDYVKFSSNVAGAPEQGNLGSVPWASPGSAVNTTGEILAPGYVFDFAARGVVGATFNVRLIGSRRSPRCELGRCAPSSTRCIPTLRGKLDNGPDDLSKISPYCRHHSIRDQWNRTRSTESIRKSRSRSISWRAQRR
jgi:hypothetical protein